MAASRAVLALASERSNAERGIQMLYRSVPAFIRLVGRVNQAAMCPGYKEQVVD